MGQTLPLVAMVLLHPVPFRGLGFGGAILLPIAGVVGTPLARAVAADITIFWIAEQFLLATLPAALLLARRARAGGLLRVASGWFERSLAKTATPLLHPYQLTALCPRCLARTQQIPARAPASAGRSHDGGGSVARVRLRNFNWEKITTQLPLWVCDSAYWPVNCPTEFDLDFHRLWWAHRAHPQQIRLSPGFLANC